MPSAPLIHDLQAIYRAAVDAVRPEALMRAFDLPGCLDRRIDAYRRVVVVGTGKASIGLAGALEGRLGDRIDEGVVSVPHGYLAAATRDLPAPARIAVVEAGHPVPDAASVEAAEQALALAAACSNGDLLLVLLSGGGSALWTALAAGVSLDDVRDTTHLLLRSGADIQAMNTVRKHLSRIKGGRLAAAAYPAAVCALALSDVVGDDLSVIASGPTVPDPTTFADAIDALRDLELWEGLPSAVRAHLAHGAADASLETPKPGDSAFDRVATHLIGSNRTALEAARAEAERRGYAARILTDEQTGEAREVGRRQAEMLLAAASDAPACLLWGGETTVTVTGSGRGGRNQELALAAALALDGRPEPVALFSGGTDGIDGPTDAAGAWATPATVGEARARDLDPRAFLTDNDAYGFFDRLGALLRPGPTHTNVMDVQIGLAGRR